MPWVTQSENNDKAHLKIRREEIDTIVKMRDSGMMIKDIAEAYDVNPATISRRISDFKNKDIK